MANTGNGTGRVGKTFNDRELAARVRTLTLKEIEKTLKGQDSEFKKAVILKLSTNILPRLNEHSGEGGGPMTFVVSGTLAEKNGIDAQPGKGSKK